MKQIPLKNVVCIRTEENLKLPEKSIKGLSCIYVKSIAELENYYEQNNIDLIIVDEKYFKQNVFSGLKSISIKYNEIPIILITENISVKYFAGAMKAGAFATLEKPIDVVDFQKKIVACSFFLGFVSREKKFIKKLSNSELKYQEKNTILETILDMLSHDTKNLFINISNLLNEIQSHSLRSMLRDAYDELYSSIMQAVGYLNSKKRIFSLIDLVSEITLTKERILLPEYERVKFTYDSKYVLYIESNPLIKNAITNLVENALKYSHKNEFVYLDISRNNDLIEISVIDSGPGITDQNKKKIFEKYFRIKKSSSIEGTGRGLWISQNIIKKEGGWLEVGDNPSGGAVFKIKLPAFKIKDEEYGKSLLAEWFCVMNDELTAKMDNVKTILQIQDPAAVTDMETAVFTYLLDFYRKEKRNRNIKSYTSRLLNLKKKNPEGKKVLIVDDSIHVHYYMGTILTKLGYSIVDYARNGAEAVSFYEKYKPDFVTMDSTMPVMSGQDAAKKIFDFDRNLKVIFITGLGDSERFIKEIKSGLPDPNYSILTKPFKRSKLLESIKYLKV